MNADVHFTPARTRVSYTMVLVGESKLGDGTDLIPIVY